MYKLKKKALFGVFWKGGDFIIKQFVVLIAKIFLIRLLVPEDFGLVAMAYLVISSLELINAFGLSPAFIRDNKSNKKLAENTLFYLRAISHIIIGVLGFFLAPYIAGFFSSKLSIQSVNSLSWMIKLLSIGHLLNLFRSVPLARLNKELKFKKIVNIEIVGIIIYGATAVILAFLGFKAWAIIIAAFTELIIMILLTFLYSPFIPQLKFSKKIAKKYINFGKNSFVTSLIKIVTHNADDTLVGRLIGVAALGFYHLGQVFAGLAVSIIASVINQVMFPIFSKLQKNKEKYSDLFFNTFHLTNLLLIPALGGLVVLIREIILFTFKDKWLPIVPIFYVLSIAALLNNLTSTYSPVLNSLNKPQILKNNSLIQFGFYVVLIYPFVKMWGMIGASWVLVIFSLISLIYLTPFIAKEIKGFYSFVFKTLSKVIPCTIFMMFSVYSVKKMLVMNVWWVFVLILLGIIVYTVPITILDKKFRNDLKEGLKLIKSKKRFKKRNYINRKHGMQKRKK